ncbi:MAG: phage tail tube protein [Hydrogenovibrio crunogenus]|nr:phage tail tube protein [Hydrogenovibrio crunogenus]
MADKRNIVTSRGFIDVPGLGRLPTKDGGKVKMGNPERKPVMGDAGALGFTEEHTEAPMISVTVVDVNDLDKQAIAKITNETVTLTTNNGQAFSLKDAWCSNSLELNVKDGTLEVEFTGLEML